MSINSGTAHRAILSGNRIGTAAWDGAGDEAWKGE